MRLVRFFLIWLIPGMYLSGFTLARKQRQLPIVLSKQEIVQLISSMTGRDKLIFQLLYGSGLRISECLRLRVKDVDTQRYSVTVHDG